MLIYRLWFSADIQNRAPFIADPMQELFLGRRGAIAGACVASIAATIGQSFSRSIAQIIGCRIITGLTLAAKASSAPLLTAEVAPNHLRGKSSFAPG
jgi:MFS family permease